MAADREDWYRCYVYLSDINVNAKSNERKLNVKYPAQVYISKSHFKKIDFQLFILQK